MYRRYAFPKPANDPEDPKEFTNLALPEHATADHEARTRPMHAELVSEVGREPDEAEAQRRADQARGNGREAPAPTR